MFQKILLWLRQVTSKVIPRQNLSHAVGADLAISPNMEGAINLWTKIYANQAPWLNEHVRSLGLATTICAKVSRVALVEKNIVISGSARANYLATQFAILDSKLREQLEYALAKGGMMFKPYVSGGEVLIDCVQADMFAPTQINGRGEITGAVFTDIIKRAGWIYTRLESHLLQNGDCIITNTAYRSSMEDTLGTTITLSTVPEWAGLEESTTIHGVDKPLYGYFKAPHSNHIDPASALGESIFARAVDLIRQADFHWERYDWEFESAERAIYVDETAVQLGEPRKARLLRLGNYDKAEFYQEFSPEIRESPFYAKLQAIFKRIEFNCGLSYGMLSDPQSKELTATEVISSKQDLYDTVEDIHRSLETAIGALLQGMDTLATLYGLAPGGNYNISYDWGDSILTDRDTERTIRMQEVAAGLSTAVEYRMWRYGEDEATARSKLPQMMELTEEG